MRKSDCDIVKDLLPLYMEKILSDETDEFVKEHIESCKECKNVYEKMKTDIHIDIDIKEEKINKKKIRYINSIKLWCLISPLIAVLFLVMHWTMALHIYKLLTALFAAAAICSEIYHGGDWWDKESMQLQKEQRENAKKNYGKVYVRPIFMGLPAILVFIILEIPDIIHWLQM